MYIYIYYIYIYIYVGMPPYKYVGLEINSVQLALLTTRSWDISPKPIWALKLFIYGFAYRI